jgi:CheY-like chemotaxis protein
MREFEGLRVLVVEDEGPIALLIEDMLQDMGCVVAASASNVGDAMRLASEGQFDFALLDVNLAGQKVDPVADVLARAGVPFAFASGYGQVGVREDLQTHPVVQKPFRAGDLAAAIRRAREG